MIKPRREPEAAVCQPALAGQVDACLAWDGGCYVGHREIRSLHSMHRLLAAGRYVRRSAPRHLHGHCMKISTRLDRVRHVVGMSTQRGITSAKPYKGIVQNDLGIRTMLPTIDRTRHFVVGTRSEQRTTSRCICLQAYLTLLDVQDHCKCCLSSCR